MEGLFWGGCCALAIAQPPAAVVLLSGAISPPRNITAMPMSAQALGVGVSSVPLLPTSLLSSSHASVTLGLRQGNLDCQILGFQLAALACVGDGRARGQIRTSFPCRCLIWLLRSGMCFASLFWFVPSEVSEVGLAGQAMLRMAAPARGRRQELPRTGAATFRVPARSGSPTHFYFLGFSPHQFPECMLWSMYSTQLVTLGQIQFSGAFLGPLRFKNPYQQIACT